jgi:hypothetical protein
MSNINDEVKKWIGKPCLLPILPRDKRRRPIVTEVVPFDGEKSQPPTLGLSQGFIQLHMPDGEKFHCGVNWFVKHVKPKQAVE